MPNHAAITPDALLAQLHWRAAVKHFDTTRKIPDATWKALEQAMVLAPSSYGLQPWKFFVVSDPAIRATLRAAAWNQPQITDASHLVVFARRAGMSEADVDRYVDRIAEVRSAPRASLDGFRGMMLGSIKPQSPEQLSNWNARQVYIALGFFLSSCAVLGVDACPMEGFDAVAFDQILNLSAHGYHATVVATAGYRAADDPYSAQPKVRFKHDAVVGRI